MFDEGAGAMMKCTSWAGASEGAQGGPPGLPLGVGRGL